MTPTQIQVLFNDAIQKSIKVDDLQQFTKDHIYNWRKGRTTPSLGDMLSLLYQLNLIEVNELTRQQNQQRQ